MAVRLEIHEEMDLAYRKRRIILSIDIDEVDLMRMLGPFEQQDLIRMLQEDRVPAAVRLYRLSDLVARLTGRDGHTMPNDPADTIVERPRAIDLGD